MNKKSQLGEGVTEDPIEDFGDDDELREQVRIAVERASTARRRPHKEVMDWLRRSVMERKKFPTPWK